MLFFIFLFPMTYHHETIREIHLRKAPKRNSPMSVFLLCSSEGLSRKQQTGFLLALLRKLLDDCLDLLWVSAD